MTYRDAITLIDNPWLRSLTTPTRWADLGCGSGVFTLALAEILAPGSTIEAIDLNPTIAAQTTPRGITIISRKADFTKLDLAPISAGPSARTPATTSPGFDGILMANSMHYVADKRDFLQKLNNHPLLLPPAPIRRLDQLRKTRDPPLQLRRK